MGQKLLLIFGLIAWGAVEATEDFCGDKLRRAQARAETALVLGTQPSTATSDAKTMASREARFRAIDRQIPQIQADISRLTDGIRAIQQRIYQSQRAQTDEIAAVEKEYEGVSFSFFRRQAARRQVVNRYSANIRNMNEEIKRLREAIRDQERKLDSFAGEKREIARYLSPATIAHAYLEAERAAQAFSAAHSPQPGTSQSTAGEIVPVGSPVAATQQPPVVWDWQAEQRRVEEERRQREQKLAEDRARLLDEILNFAKDNSFAQQELQDILVERKISAEFAGKVKIVLLLGSDLDANVEEAIIEAKRLGYSFLYDADSPSAAKLLSLLEDRGIGVSAFVHNPEMGIFQIHNPYRRLMIFDVGTQYGISQAENPLAWATLLLNYKKRVLFQGSHLDLSKWVDGPLSWQQYLRDTSRSSFGLLSWGRSDNDAKRPQNVNLGIDLYVAHDKPKVAPTKIQFEPSGVVGKPLKYEFSIFDRLQTLDADKLRIIKEDIKAFNHAMTKNNRPGLPKGAVLFGSGSGNTLYEDLVYSVSRSASELLGLMASGGAGGYMRTANSAAVSAGAFSVGIPMGSGRVHLANEQVVHRETQSLTIPTHDYTSRIPTLLNNRAIVLVAPGGLGTLRELATWIVQEAYNPMPSQLVFVSEAYYGPLYDWLKSLPLPEVFKSSIHLVNSAESFFALARRQMLASPEQIVRAEERNRAKRIQSPKPVPTPSPSPSRQASGTVLDPFADLDLTSLDPGYEENVTAPLPEGPANNDTYLVEPKPNDNGGEQK